MQLSGNFVQTKSDDVNEVSFENNEQDDIEEEEITVKPSFKIEYNEEIDIDDI